MNRGLADWSRYGGVALSWAFLTAALLYAGYRGGQWLDARWNTEPIFLVTGLMVAALVSLVALVQEVQAVVTALGQGSGASDGQEEGPPSSRRRRPPRKK